MHFDIHISVAALNIKIYKIETNTQQVSIVIDIYPVHKSEITQAFRIKLPLIVDKLF